MIQVDDPLTELVAAANAVLRPDPAVTTAPPRIAIKTISVEQMLCDGKALFDSHWNETANYVGVAGVKLDVEVYRTLEAQKLLMLIAVYMGEEMVGYSINIVLPNQFSQDMNLCRNDAFFVLPRWRRTRVPVRLLRETESQAKARGAVRMVWAVTATSPMAGWLPRLGYGQEEIVFTKEI